MTTHELSYIRNRAYVAVSLTHFFVDVLNNSRTLLVAILALDTGAVLRNYAWQCIIS
jgi:hypothetical protein